MAKAPKIERRFLRTAEAAAYMGVSDWTVKRLVQSGELAYIQFHSGPWLFDVRDLDACIERHKQTATHPF